MSDKKPASESRSPLWPTVRKQHLKRDPVCRACGSNKHLEVHHRLPFHVHPELELVDTNLITLCESPSHNCHLIWGHLLNWAAWNPAVETDAESYRREVAGRSHE